MVVHWMFSVLIHDWWSTDGNLSSFSWSDHRPTASPAGFASRSTFENCCCSSNSFCFQSFDLSSLKPLFSLFCPPSVCQDQVPLRTYLMPTSALSQVILQQVRSIERYCPFWVERENETLLKLCGAWTLQQRPCTMCNYFEIGRTMETCALCWK